MVANTIDPNQTASIELSYLGPYCLQYCLHAHVPSRKYRDLNSNVCFGAQNNCLSETVLFSTPNLLYKLYLVRTLCFNFYFFASVSHLLHI